MLMAEEFKNNMPIIIPKQLIMEEKPAAGNNKADKADQTSSETGKEGEPSQEFLEKLRWLSSYFEKLKIGDYVQMVQEPKRLIKVNFFVGIARGIGIGIGFTLLGAFALYLLNKLAILNLPLIGNFISELMDYIEKIRGMRI